MAEEENKPQEKEEKPEEKKESPVETKKEEVKPAEEKAPEKTEEKKPEEKKPQVSKEKPKEEKKEKVKPTEAQVKDSDNKDEKKGEKPEEKKEEKPEVKEPAKEKEEVSKKDEAVVNGSGLRASKKHCMYICSFIKNKTIDSALSDLDQVIKMKRAIPFKGEIPHRKGKGMMSGRYPVRASKQFIYLLKALKGNLIVNGLDPDKARITIASASWASRPMRSRGRQAKRTNVILMAREVKEAKK